MTDETMTEQISDSGDNASRAADPWAAARPCACATYAFVGWQCGLGFLLFLHRSHGITQPQVLGWFVLAWELAGVLSVAAGLFAYSRTESGFVNGWGCGSTVGGLLAYGGTAYVLYCPSIANDSTNWIWFSLLALIGGLGAAFISAMMATLLLCIGARVRLWLRGTKMGIRSNKRATNRE